MLAFGKSKLQIFIWRHLSFALPSFHLAIPRRSRAVSIRCIHAFCLRIYVRAFWKIQFNFHFSCTGCGISYEFLRMRTGRAGAPLAYFVSYGSKIWRRHRLLSLSLSACCKFLLAVAISIPNFLHNLSNLDKLSPLPLLNLWILYGLLKVFLKTDLSRGGALA